MDFSRIIEAIKAFLKDVDQVHRDKATHILEWELGELENIFAILVLGMFIGVPAPPIHVVMALFPEMEHEYQIMLDKVLTAHDPLGELFSVLEIG